MNLDWHRLKAVVFESDDWGLCAWSADVQALRVLQDTPAFRTPAGRRYAGSTLESAQDVKALAATLAEFRGGDGFPPVWQANMIVAAPDFERMHAPLFECDTVPLRDYPDVPSRWRRPGAWEEVQRAMEEGVWWPELHGLHHVPETAWIRALRRGAADARRAHEQQSAVCLAVETSGEHDPSEPPDDRARRLELAVAKFTALTGAAPRSFCPPDYRSDERTRVDAHRLGMRILQGRGEQHGARFPRLRRLLLRQRWPGDWGVTLEMPPRIAFEPRVLPDSGPRLDVEATHRAAREAWSRGRPAVISTHRVNYVHLDAASAAAGRAQLRDLLARLTADGAVFLTDFEVRQLLENRWSCRPIGRHSALLRYTGVPREPFRFPAPIGAARVSIREGRGQGGGDGSVMLENGDVIAELNVGEYMLEWK